MDRSTLKNKLQEILTIQKVPALDQLDYAVARDRFAYVSVRDTLLQCGIRFTDAERLAFAHRGPPLNRLLACLKEINQNG